MLHRLSSDRLELIVDDACGGLEVLHLGAPIGDITPDAVSVPVAEGGFDVVAPMAIMPEEGASWGGAPGVEAHRSGQVVFPRFGSASVTVDGLQLTAVADDPANGLRQSVDVRLHPAGVLEVAVEIENVGFDALTVDAVTLTVPVPHAHEVMHYGGRWSDEFHTVRHAWDWGTFVVENRAGRTSHQRHPALFAGSAAFAEQAGSVTAVHLGWSGNSIVRADRLLDGRRVLQAGELLLSGEVVLGAGETYRSPPMFVAHSEAGLNGISAAFHDMLRARPSHPSRPRPVLLNTWEAVYFDHDLPTLTALADRAAAVGVERFVLDDGWFRGRDDDRRSLGDWTVDAAKWPDGLGPLVDHVRGLDMEFGLWVEPEMVNPDSDLYRAHPDWVLADRRHEPVRFRHQLVLDLTNPGAYAHIRDHLLELLGEYDIAYLKWDMNRDHTSPTDAAGRAGTHRQTRAVYALLDELRAAYPDVEIESCSSGGGRIDFGILDRTDRVWTSDCNDALDRVRIQRGVSYLIPPELMGAHIGPTRAHTTGRTHHVAFRGATALFGHLGIEWNLLTAEDHELAAVERVVGLHKQLRPILHAGTTLRIDVPDPALSAFVVVADAADEAVLSISQIATSRALAAGAVRVPGLDPDRRYRIEALRITSGPLGKAKRQPAWLEGTEVSGRQLATAGLSVPILNPETALLVSLRAD